eukprot:scaffold21628_cov71-Isochrysis_galbana.AAC.1
MRSVEPPGGILGSTGPPLGIMGAEDEVEVQAVHSSQETEEGWGAGHGGPGCHTGGGGGEQVVWLPAAAVSVVEEHTAGGGAQPPPERRPGAPHDTAGGPVVEWAEGLRLHLSHRSPTGYLCVARKGSRFAIVSRSLRGEPAAAAVPEGGGGVGEAPEGAVVDAIPEGGVDPEDGEGGVAPPQSPGGPVPSHGPPVPSHGPPVPSHGPPVSSLRFDTAMEAAVAYARLVSAQSNPKGAGAPRGELGTRPAAGREAMQAAGQEERWEFGEAMEVEAEGASTDEEESVPGVAPPESDRQYRGGWAPGAEPPIPPGGVKGLPLGGVNSVPVGGVKVGPVGTVNSSANVGPVGTVNCSVNGGGVSVGSVVEVEVAEAGDVSWQFARVVAVMPNGEFDAMVADDHLFIERCAGGEGG